jgi:hypothetical protein
MKLLSKLCFVSVLILIAFPAQAATADNTLGVYFDEQASMVCVEGIVPYALLPVYVILSNPTMDMLYGFEFGITVTGPPLVFSTFTHPCGISVDPVDLGDVHVSCSVGVPGVANTVLASMEWMLMTTSTDPTLIFLHNAANPSQPGEWPLIHLADGSLVPTGVNAILDMGVTAAISSGSDICYPLPVGEHSWEAVKSLYR